MIDHAAIEIYCEKLMKHLAHFIFLAKQTPILSHQIEIADKLLEILKQKNQEAVSIVVSHLAALMHYLKIACGKSIQLQLFLEEVQQCINEKEILFKNVRELPALSVSQKTVTPFTSSNIVSDQQHYQKELQLYAEQKHLNSLTVVKKNYEDNVMHDSRMRLFLHEIQRYALGISDSVTKSPIKPIPVKDVFISYAWPIANLHQEAWTSNFIKNLVQHLVFAGIPVYLDQYDSGPGHNLRLFMQKIQKSGLVLVFSSRTWDFKISLPVSGIKYETDQIKASLHAQGEKDFVTVVCLNEQNYCKKYFPQAHELSFNTVNYLENLKNLIAHIYELNIHLFNEFWQQQLIKHKILRNFYGLLPRNPIYIKSSSTFDRLNLLCTVSPSSSVGTKLVVYGAENMGKTEMMLQYITEYGQFFESVVWFNAQNAQRLLAEYKDYAVSHDILTTNEISTLSAAQIIAKVIAWLQNKNNFLIIYDDIRDDTVLSYLPSGKVNVVLITNSFACKTTLIINGFKEFVVEEMLPDAAFALVESSLGREKCLKYLNEIKKLIEILQANPGKLVHACGYIHRNKKTPAEFLQLLQSKPDLLEHYQLTIKSPPAATTQLPSSIPSIERTRADLTAVRISPQYDELLVLMKSCQQLLHFPWMKLFSPVMKGMMNCLHQVQNNEFQQDAFLSLILSHLQSIQYFTQYIIVNKSEILLDDYKKQINQLLNKSRALLEKSKFSPSVRSLTSVNLEALKEPCIIQQTHNDIEVEQNRFNEQQEFHDYINLRNASQKVHQVLLMNVWQYALKASGNINYFTTKKVYISFAWPTDSSSENWTSEYIITVAKHLIHAGVQVYLPGIYPQEMFGFDELIKQGHKFDFVLIISSRSREAQLKRKDEQFNLIQQDQVAILRYFTDKQGTSDQPIIIPVLLNNINHCCEPLISQFAELSFYKTDYVKALRQLLSTIYGFDVLKFRHYWNNQLIKYGVGQKLWHVPPRNPYFTGKQNKELLAEVAKYLSEKENNTINISTYSGFGGVGKSTLAKEFAYLFGYRFGRVYWFNASSVESLLSDYVKLGEEVQLFTKEMLNLSLEQRARIVINWLENIQSEGWCLILDNVPQYEHVRKFIPVKGGRVIITSRHTEFPGKTITLNGFSEDDILEYAQKVTGRYEPDVIQAMIKKIGKLPLTWTHICAYVKTKNCSFAHYLQLLQENSILSIKSPDALEKEPLLPIEVTWDITLKAIKEHNEDLGIELLGICAYLSAHDIPLHLLRNYLLFRGDHTVDIPVTPPEIIAFDNAMRVCAEYSMIAYNPDETGVTIHNHLQEVMRKSLINRKDEKEYIKIVMKLLFCYLKSIIDTTNYAGNDNVLLHINQLWEFAKNYQNNLQLDESVLFALYLIAAFEMSSYYTEHAKYKSYFESAIIIMNKAPVAKVFKLLAGIIYLCFDDIQDKQRNVQQFLADINFDQIADDILNSDNNPWLENLFRVIKTLMGNDHRWAAWVGACLHIMFGMRRKSFNGSPYEYYLMRLQHFLGADNQTMQAFNLIVIAIKLASNSLVMDQANKDTLVKYLSKPNIVSAIQSYGFTPTSVVDQPLALALLRGYLNSQMATEAKKMIVELLHNLFGDIKDWLSEKNSITSLTKAVEIISKTWAHDHIHIGRLNLKLGRLYQDFANYAKAIECYDKAMPIMKRFLGENHSDVVSLMLDVAACYIFIDLDNENIVTNMLQVKEMLERNKIEGNLEAFQTLKSKYAAIATQLIEKGMDAEIFALNFDTAAGYSMYGLLKPPAANNVPLAINPVVSMPLPMDQDGSAPTAKYRT